MEESLVYKNHLLEKGFVVVPSEESPFSSQDIEEMLQQLHPEKITYSLSFRGDTEEAAYTNYFRLRHPDLEGTQLPELVDIVEGEKVTHFLKNITELPTYEIDRCQSLFYGPGGFVENHVDADHYAGYSHTVVLMLDSSVSGGELAITDRNGQRNQLDLSKGELLIFDARLAHEVLPIKSGFRKSFIFFLKVR